MVPAYMIFSDKTLSEMAQNKPISEKAMKSITGVGEKKYEEFGETFIKIIRNFIKENEQKGNTLSGATHLTTYEMYKAGKAPEKIAFERELATSTIYSHLAKLYEDGYDIDIEKFITDKEYEKIAAYIYEHGIPEKLRPMYEALHEKIEYPIIRIGLSLFKANNL